MQAMLPTLERAALQGQVGEEDAERLARWAELAGSLVEAYTQLLWLEPEVSDSLRLEAEGYTHIPVPVPVYNMKDAAKRLVRYEVKSIEPDL